MTVAAGLERVRARIRAAGGDPGSLEIVAVSKGRAADACRQALSAGLRSLGENRVQEALAKMDEVPGAEWHLIGHLQANKVRLAAGRFALIQSVDSAALASAMQRRAPEQAVLLQVNVAREAQKHGCDPARAMETAMAIAGLLDLRGLMGMGPSSGDPRPAFDELREIRERIQQRLGRELPVLSMGMSEDLEAAVAAGSSMLRLGRALFGAVSLTPGSGVPR